MPNDDEGYSCFKGKNRWYIINRYGKPQRDHPTFAHSNHAGARKYADQLNKEVIERRFQHGH